MRRSVLARVPHFDFGRGFPQDVMHDLLRGPLEQALCHFLLTMIDEQRATLADILTKCTTLARSWRWRSSSPQFPSFSLDNLRNGSLDDTASETLTLCLCLPCLFPRVFLSTEAVGTRLGPAVALCVAGFKLLQASMKSSYGAGDTDRIRYI